MGVGGERDMLGVSIQAIEILDHKYGEYVCVVVYLGVDGWMDGWAEMIPLSKKRRDGLFRFQLTDVVESSSILLQSDFFLPFPAVSVTYVYLLIPHVVVSCQPWLGQVANTAAGNVNKQRRIIGQGISSILSLSLYVPSSLVACAVARATISFRSIPPLLSLHPGSTLPFGAGQSINLLTTCCYTKVIYVV